ncbi:MAG: molecular chaperone Tir [Candidatus Schekmanbacteria bacterium RBG_13_48_7]|uniref:Molecular chaperone Tir n=1 Tax=Candidatus Schekmanbacteria bacterium RBG_13_48_7 TaxID=1817878 RepID=A0A1F7RUF7_9BACT|nr:MAG: molecular chaperone Tir [Candidatus Schekmanbacteria bacterium RBG_13_48_7]
MTTHRPQVFYSFHFDNDVFRVQQIRNIGVIEGNEPVSKNDWETLRNTPSGIERWIDENMKYKTCVVVLIGSETVQRPWVRYEIAKGWDDGKGILGIYIHNLRDPQTAKTPPYYGRCAQGQNPFEQVTLKNGTTIAKYVPCFNPNPSDAYVDIAQNLLRWVAQAAKRS